MWERRTEDLGPEPRTFSTAQVGGRADRLRKRPGVHPLVHGHWAEHHGPLSVLHRSLLITTVLERPGSQLYVTGLPALRWLHLPVGPELGWTRPALCGLVADTGMPPRGDVSWRRPHALMRQRHGRTLHEVWDQPHLAWTGQRVHYRGAGARVEKGTGLPLLPVPWGGGVAHPIEALSVMAPLLAPWRLVACLDAMMSYRYVIDGTRARGVLSRDFLDHGVSLLPPTSPRTLAVARALGLARTPVWSPFETLTRLILLAHGLPEPGVNLRVPLDGRWVHLDLAWEEARVAIEYNGRVHSRNHGQYKDEMRRFAQLRTAGWEVIVLTEDDLKSHRRCREWLMTVTRLLT